MIKIWIVRFEGEERDTYMTFGTEDDAYNLGVHYLISENLMILEGDPEALRHIDNMLVADIDQALDAWNASTFNTISVTQTVLGKLTHNQTYP